VGILLRWRLGIDLLLLFLPLLRFAFELLLAFGCHLSRFRRLGLRTRHIILICLTILRHDGGLWRSSDRNNLFRDVYLFWSLIDVLISSRWVTVCSDDRPTSWSDRFVIRVHDNCLTVPFLDHKGPNLRDQWQADLTDALASADAFYCLVNLIDGVEYVFF